MPEVNDLIATLAKWGNSQGVRIPKHILEDARMASDETVDIQAGDGMIIIKKIRARKTIQELFAGYNDEYQSREIDWGEATGDELW
jgi:antitoxin MazE